MDRGAWWASVHGTARVRQIEQLTLAQFGGHGHDEHDMGAERVDSTPQV